MSDIEYVRLGEQYLGEGRWEAAARAASLALELRPGCVAAGVLRARAYLKGKRYGHALFDLDRLLHRYDAEPLPWALRAQVWKALGMWDWAEHDLARAAALQPQYREAMRRLLWRRDATVAPRRRHPFLAARLQRHPLVASLHFQKSAELWEQGRLSEAASALTHCLDLGPHRYAPAVVLARILNAMGAFPKAYEHHRKLAQRWPSARAWYETAHVCVYGLKRYREALEALAEAIKLDPTPDERRDIRTLQGLVHGFLGENEQALRLLEEAERHGFRPEQADSIRLKMGRLLQKLGRHEEAEKKIAGLQVDPHLLACQEVLGALERDHPEAAEAAARYWLQRFPDSSCLLLAAAVGCEIRGRSDQADEFLDKARPDLSCVGLLRLWATYRGSSCLPVLKRWLADGPDPVLSLMIEATEAGEAGDFPTALSRLEQARRLDPDEPELLRLRAQVHRGMGWGEAAQRDEDDADRMEWRRKGVWTS